MVVHCNFCAHTGKYQSDVNQHALQKHFYCIPCRNKNETFEEVLDHQKDVHGRDFACNICSKRFLRSSHLQRHLKEHQEVYECNICSFRTIDEKNLEEHTKALHLDQKDIQCPHCDFKTAWQRSLYDHLKTQHQRSSLPKLTCPQCDFVTHSKSSLRTHQKVHRVVKDNIECEHCGTKFTRKESYDKHMRIAHGNSKTFKCDECDFVSKYPQAIKRHRLWKHTENNKQFQCDLCEKAYVTKKDLKHHTETAHLQIKKYKCEVCEFECYQKQSFKRHMDEHLPDDEKLKCDYCSYVTPNKNVLDRHVELSHINRPKGTNNFRNCVLCDYVAESGYDYKQHIASNHRGTLKCEFCDYETHERKCMGEHREKCGPDVKMHHCYKCDFKCPNVQYLGRHLNQVHGKNTKCEKCDYRTDKTQDMRRHERRCYKLEWYTNKCDFCDYKSFSKTQMKRHIQKCQSEKLHKCSKCDLKPQKKSW